MTETDHRTMDWSDAAQRLGLLFQTSSIFWQFLRDIIGKLPSRRYEGPWLADRGVVHICAGSSHSGGDETILQSE